MKKPSDIKRVNFSRTKSSANGLVRIGGAAFGKIYIGRIHFNNGSTHRVAIKIFRDKLNNETAARYQQAIQDLRRAGVQLPKMGMHKLTEGPHKGEWVQISQLFGSTKKGSKIENKTNLIIKTAKAREEAIRESTKIANAGYLPALDTIETFKNQTKGIIPIDIDLIGNSKIPALTRAGHLIFAIEDMTKNKTERRKLLRTAIQMANPEMKKALQQHTQ